MYTCCQSTYTAKVPSSGPLFHTIACLSFHLLSTSAFLQTLVLKASTDMRKNTFSMRLDLSTRHSVSRPESPDGGDISVSKPTCYACKATFRNTDALRKHKIHKR